jgi:hypothetical protein
MSKTDKAALAKDATAIRKAEQERDGTLAGATKEIVRLHGEIEHAGKMVLEKAIRVGELLYRVRSSRKGNWLKWLADTVPFSQKTAWNYMAVYQRRVELKLVNVTNLSDAYARLLPPKDKPRKRQTKTSAIVEAMEAKGIPSHITKKFLTGEKEATTENKAAVPGPVEKPKRRTEPPKGWVPEPLGKGDLTDEERKFLSSIPEGRRKAFIRAICEGDILKGDL